VNFIPLNFGNQIIEKSENLQDIIKMKLNYTVVGLALSISTS
jgi:hypothetical protein